LKIPVITVPKFTKKEKIKKPKHKIILDICDKRMIPCSYYKKGENMPFNDPEQPKRLVIQISTERHIALKMVAAKLETTMDKLVNELIENKIQEENK